MGQFTDYANENVPNPADKVVILDEGGITKYMTREDFFKDPLFEDGAITAIMLAPKQVQTVASATTITPDDGVQLIKVTALATGLTMNNPTETFTTERQILVRIKDNGTARTLAWASMWRAIGITLPTTTVATKTYYIGGLVNLEDNKIDVLSVAREA